MTRTSYAVDNSAILYLALMRRSHTNSYRFTVTMDEEVDPHALQQAMEHVYRRFPTIIAGFRRDLLRYRVVPADSAPTVLPDPGLLIPMTRQEIARCAYRIFYSGRDISLEAFHALTDGYGALASLTTLIAEYLHIRGGTDLSACTTVRRAVDAPTAHELEDSYLTHQQGKPLHLPSRYAYQLPGGNSLRNSIYTHTARIPAERILNAARTHGVSITALIGTVMASAIMEVQKRNPAKALKPVRIMVPVDLRRMFPSQTFRNFILYVLPTLEPEDRHTPICDRLRSFARQIQSQLNPDRLASIMAYNVRTQRSWYFQWIPLSLKMAFMRLAYRYFGESNSSITMTNLGNVRLPEQMQPFVEGIEVLLTPRARSPYNCGIISCNGQLAIHISRFRKESEFENIFQGKLNEILDGVCL